MGKVLEEIFRISVVDYQEHFIGVITASEMSINCLSSGEHHFSLCQIIRTDVSWSPAAHFNLARLPCESASLTEISGQMVMPTPWLRHALRLLTLENL